MIIQTTSLDTALRRAKHLSAQILNRKQKLDFVRTAATSPDSARIAARSKFLSEGGTHPSDAEFERLLGTNDLVDEFFLERALLAAQPVCRISIRAPGGRERGCATGFMISPRLLLTNHHVFSTADEAAPSIAEFNYRLDIAGNPEPSFRFPLRPDRFFFTHERLDFTVVAVDDTPQQGEARLSQFGYHRLIPESGKAQLKEWMNIIQHPGGARRQFAMRDNQCIADNDPDVIWYMSDTSQGSSGAPVLNDSFQVVALHHSGVPHQDSEGRYVLKSGKTVSSLREVDDSEVDWVANAGIRISRVCATLEAAPDAGDHLREWRESTHGGDVLSRAYTKSIDHPDTTSMNPTLDPKPSGSRIVLGTLVLELNGALSFTARSPEPAPPSTPAPGNPSLDNTSSASEAMKEPIVAPNLESRKGFDPKFLGLSTPLPTVIKRAVVAPLKAGGTVLRYEHFSLVMHKERRLAIFTASNVDGRPNRKKPEPGRDYTRKGLTGLGEHDTEKWVNDERLDDAYQLPDKFYTKDNGAFDKGHIVRREDACWGQNYDEVRRANGDTFHVTNCSPQRGNFNQSAKGGIWGKLENFIGAQADKEVYCLFAGPILDDNDVLFDGVDQNGAVKVRIPRRFWKVVCAVKSGKLQVFPFILEQEVADLVKEFDLTAEWKHSLVSLKALEKELKLVKFPKLYHTADQGK